MTAKACMHCFISGQVQGVWFRVSAQREALRLGMTGWVQNCSDGRVAVKACGDKSQLDEFYAWLKIGPKLANVSEVTRKDSAFEQYETFAIKASQ